MPRPFVERVHLVSRSGPRFRTTTLCFLCHWLHKFACDCPFSGPVQDVPGGRVHPHLHWLIAFFAGDALLLAPPHTCMTTNYRCTANYSYYTTNSNRPTAASPLPDSAQPDYSVHTIPLHSLFSQPTTLLVPVLCCCQYDTSSRCSKGIREGTLEPTSKLLSS